MDSGGGGWKRLRYWAVAAGATSSDTTAGAGRTKTSHAGPELSGPCTAAACPPLILRSLGEGGLRAAASASPPAFLSSRVPYAFLPTPIIPHPNRRRQPPHFAKCGGGGG